ncbi:MAG TPA: hypothetical protein VFT59_00235 [Candidatus Saccharimonadales bacterium]|nr:hypothetical protein [Candidatus Saccharimonadales bacterium]
MEYASDELLQKAREQGITLVCQDLQTLQIQCDDLASLTVRNNRIASHVSRQLGLPFLPAHLTEELRELVESRFAKMFQERGLVVDSRIRFLASCRYHPRVAARIADMKIYWSEEGVPVMTLHIDGDVQVRSHFALEVIRQATVIK